jgi:predicted transcriptional regulator
VTTVARELDMRRSIRNLVEAYPGLHLREIARQAGTSEALAAYHLEALEQAGLVEGVVAAGFRRFFPLEAPAPAEEDRELIGVLRQETPVHIALYLLDKGAATQGDLARELGVAKSTMSYHVGGLRAIGLLEENAEGRLRLVDPKRVGRLLMAWEPTDNMSTRFARLWAGFYRRRR